MAKIAATAIEKVLLRENIMVKLVGWFLLLLSILLRWGWWCCKPRCKDYERGWIDECCLGCLSVMTVVVDVGRSSSSSFRRRLWLSSIGRKDLVGK